MGISARHVPFVAALVGVLGVCNSQEARAQSCTTAGGLGQACGPAQLDGQSTLSSNTVTAGGSPAPASWSGSQARTLGARASDVINVKDFGAKGNYSINNNPNEDDTAAIQAAINAATSQNLGYKVVVPPGTYVITHPLTALITGNAGLDFESSGSGEVIFLAQYPTTATNWDLFDITLGQNSETNGPDRVNAQNGQFLKIGGFTAIQNDAVGHPAGSIIQVTASQSTASTVLPGITMFDIYGVGGQQNGADTTGQSGVNTMTGNGENSGFDAWLNGVALIGVNSATITGLGLEGPLEAGVITSGVPNGQCDATHTELGETFIPSVTVGSTTISPHSSCMVAGAAVLIGSSNNYNLTTGGVNYSGGNVKGYVAAMAIGGQAQGFGFSNINAFNDEYGVMIGGGQILDQLGGPVVNALASGTSTYGATAATQSITLSAANSSIMVGMRAVGNFLPLGAYVKSISGTTVTIAREDGASFGIGGNFPNEPVSFTNGFVLTSPGSATGTMTVSFGCDVWQACVSAPNDPDTFFGFNNIVADNNNIVSNDSSPNFTAFVVGRSFGHQFDSNDLQQNRGYSQRFISATNEFNAPGLDAQNNIISSGTSSAYQIDLQGFGGSAVSGNSLIGNAPLGEDAPYGSEAGCASVFGVNMVGNSAQIGLSSCPGLSYDAQDNLTVPGFVAGSIAGNATAIAGTGTSQSGATQLTAQTSLVACASGATAYLVPSTAEIGDQVIVDNVGSNACLIYPQTGMQLAYDLSPNTAFVLPAGATQSFKLQTSTSWIREERNLVVDSVTPTPTTVGGLGSCTSALLGRLRSVTDASSPTYLGTLSGGGSTVALALCNGSNWVAH